MTRQNMFQEARALAYALSLFYAENDPYDYMDSFGENGVEELAASIVSGHYAQIIDALALFAEESEDLTVVQEACALIRRLDVFRLLYGKGGRKDAAA